MPTTVRRPLSLDETVRCRIRVDGPIDDATWADRLAGLAIRVSTTGGSPVTDLCGPLADQAALVGLLVGLYDLGLPLLSVACRPARGRPGARRRRPRGRDPGATAGRAQGTER